MELHEAIRRRAMVRSFSSEPVDRRPSNRILVDALRSPTAGNTGGTAWVVLEGPDETSVYFDATTDECWRDASHRWRGPAPGAGRPARLLIRRRCTSPATRARQGGLRAGRGLRPVARPLLDGGRRLRRHDSPAGCRRRRPRCLHPGHLPRRSRAERQARSARWVAPLLRGGAGSARWPGPSLAVTRPSPPHAGRPDPPGPLVTRSIRPAGVRHKRVPTRRLVSAS